MGRKKHIDALKEFKAAINKNRDIEKMILFGSRAKGKPTRWSDFDLLIISRSFKGKKFRYRALDLYDHWILDYPVDFLCYTPEEFEKRKKQITLVQTAVKEGIVI